MFDVVNGTAPQYLRDMLTQCRDRQLGLSVQNLVIKVKQTRNDTSECDFYNTGDTMWKSLPTYLRDIRSLCWQF